MPYPFSLLQCTSALPSSDGKNIIRFGRIDRAWSNPDVRHIREMFYNASNHVVAAPYSRAGSYGLNAWLLASSKNYLGYSAAPQQRFELEPRIKFPSATPLLGDCVTTSSPADPMYERVNETLPTWIFGPEDSRFSGAPGPFSYFLVARHGKRPNRIPGRWTRGQKLPGAISVAFFDGHSEKVPLEKLWTSRWYYGYEPPNKWPVIE